MKEIQDDELIIVYNKLCEIRKQTAESILIIEGMLDICGSKYNPDEYLKKWLKSDSFNLGLIESSRGDK